MIDRLIAALREAQLNLDWRDLADVLWLADVRARAAAEKKGLADGAAAVSGERAADRPGIAQPASLPTLGAEENAPSRTQPTAAEGPTRLPTAGWQLTQQGGADDSGGVGLEAVAPARYALPGGQEIGRALRPLKQRRRTPRLRVFDPEATVDLFCDTGVLTPVLRPGLERWFDVAVVADTAATMAVWDDTVVALANLLERHGAFRAVSRWRFREQDGEIEMLTPPGLAHRPYELLDPAGRRLILVVTDAVDELWARTPVWRAIREWGRHGPVALVQLLPPRSWAQTQVGEADAAVMATRPGQPNQQLDVAPPWWWLKREPPEHVVPVLGLDEASLAPWARMVMGAVGVPVPGVIPVPDGPTDAAAKEDGAAGDGGALGIVPADAGGTQGEADLDRLGNVLRSTVSAQAYRLAVLLSAVEVSLPIARIVMHQLMPQARLAHLAELVAAGVLRAERVEAAGGGGRSNVALTFAPGLRNLLQRSLTVTMTLQVWRAVAPYLETTRALPRFSLLLESAARTTEADSVTEAVREGMQNIASDLAIRFGLKPTPGAVTPVPESAQSSTELIEGLFDHDPVVSLSAVGGLTEVGASIVPDVVGRLSGLNTVTIIAVRTLLSRFPEESADLMSDRILNAHRDWQGANFIPDCFSPQQRPFCADLLAQHLDDYEPDVVRKCIESLGFLAAETWGYRLVELMLSSDRYLYGKYASYIIPARARMLVMLEADWIEKEWRLRSTFDDVERVIAEASARGWQGIQYRVLQDVLGKCQPRHADHLITSWLTADLVERRSLAASALGQMRLRRSLPYLIDRAKSTGETDEVRHEAVFAIANIGGPDAVTSLEDLLNSVRDNERRSADVRWALVHCLADATDDSQFARLAREVLAHPPSEVSFVHRAVGLRRDDRFTSELRRGLESAEPTVRGYSALALARIGDTAAHESLIRVAAEAGNTQERILASLGFLSIGESVPGDPELRRLRADLSRESFQYKRLVTDDILQVLSTSEHPCAVSIAEAWRGIYSEGLDY